MRMYFLVMYNLMGIQKGIQAGHAALEYANQFNDSPEYRDFIENHKTFIILDGGGSKEMEAYHAQLHEAGYPYAAFREPDLNMSVSAIAFLVPESIYGMTSEEALFRALQQVGSPVEDKDLWLYQFVKQFHLARN